MLKKRYLQLLALKETAMIDSFWKGKNIFITGINGFIGSNLAKLLISCGANVFGLVRNPDNRTLLYYEKIDKKIILINGDLCDKELISRIISEEQIDTVFHLAAQVEVGVGIENPYLTFETNVRGTYTVLEAIRAYPKNIKSVVVASSDKAYGSYDKSMMPYKEDYPLIPKYPYDTSKACADLIAKSYANDIYNLPIVVTRFSNIFGPGQLNFSAIIPDGIRSALGISSFIPRGDGSAIRDFIYVEDVCDLYLKIARKIAESKNNNFHGEVFNAGTNSPISMKEVISKIFISLGNNKDLDKILKLMEGKVTQGEIDTQYMDYDKVNKYFDWSPNHDFDSGLEKTIKWFQDYLAMSKNKGS
tara:strand:- start:1298 stop:2377 length:1080 start_codon:yes stop_codon:yes gene_type:complete